jgi:hypothetical protein
MGGWTTALKLGERAAHFAAHNPKTVLGGIGTTVVGWKYFANDQSLIEQAADVGLGEDAAKQLKDGGVVGGLKQAAFGNGGSDKSIGENVVDGVAGDGTYQQIGQTAGQVVDKAGNALQSVGSGVQQAFSGGDQQAGAVGQAMPFGGLGQLVSSFWSGGSGLSLAALIPAAFLMFGNFGWMGKIASLLLGSLAWRNMHQPQLMLPQQQMSVQQQYHPQLVQAEPDVEEEETNNHTIRRGRG